MPSAIQPEKDGKPKNMTTLSIRNSVDRSPFRSGLPRKQQLPRAQAMWIIRGFLLLPLALGWFAFSPKAQALCREGCDLPSGITFLGDEALLNDDTGFGNTAVGDHALYTNTIGNDNTASGFNSLYYNTSGDDNTANGLGALFSNTTGSRNVAIGSNALSSNQTGGDNTATGVNALAANTADYNTATGYQALESNTTGSSNTAHGLNALNSNTTGSNNTANGASALFNNLGGTGNTAEGYLALHENTSGINNTALGTSALYSNTTGGTNIAIGLGAGFFLTTGSNNIDIANLGVAGDSRRIRIGTKGTHTNANIAGISGVTVAGGVGVIIDTNGHLGTVTSSERFKDAIKPMDKASEVILALKPVTFRYKHDLDPDAIPQFGLVAEQVEKVNPDLVARDGTGRPYTVRYEAVNAMLLNEFLKEHRTVQELKKEIAALTATVKEQAAQIQKVSRQVGLSKPAPQMVFNNQ
ncbi:MAG: hypothetical protein DMF00_07080 [Verrucomicrobia bacterium]|nr:MAG: hypothetical protein DMF00_07080 [Verrucomicrobiota bacterium]